MLLVTALVTLSTPQFRIAKEISKRLMHDSSSDLEDVEQYEEELTKDSPIFGSKNQIDWRFVHLYRLTRKVQQEEATP